MKKIEHINKRIGSVSQLEVKEIAEYEFELIYSDPLDHRYNSGTIVKTKINADGQHEIIEFKKTDRVTHRFVASIEQNMRDFDIFIADLHKHGGRFQIDAGGLVSVTVPKDFPFNIDKIIEDYSIKVSRM